jgi:hypothetical protein
MGSFMIACPPQIERCLGELKIAYAFIEDGLVLLSQLPLSILYQKISWVRLAASELMKGRGLKERGRGFDKGAISVAVGAQSAKGAIRYA